jgi:hypothetical protein
VTHNEELDFEYDMGCRDTFLEIIDWLRDPKQPPEVQEAGMKLLAVWTVAEARKKKRR